MNWLVAVWACMAGVNVALGLVNLTLWLRSRSREHLRFLLVCVLALAVCVFGYVELRLMTLQSVEEAVTFLRVGHVFILVIVFAMALLVHVHFGTGRTWLLWSALASRLAVVIATFLSPVNVNYLEVRSLRTVPLLGEQVTIVGDATPNPWGPLTLVATVLFLAYVIDASVALWRKGDPLLRRRTLLIGGSIVATVLLVNVVNIPKHLGVLDLPYLITPSFLFVVMAISHELTTDVLRTEELNRRLTASHDKLRDAEQRLQLATDAAGVGIWEWHVGTETVHVSRQAAKLLGQPSAEVLSSQEFLDRIHPEERPGLGSVLGRAVADGQGFDVWARMQPSEDRQRWVALKGRVSRERSLSSGTVLGVLMDVTERQEADQRVRAIAASVPIGVLMVDDGGRIVFANRKADDIFGYEQGELIGQPLERLLPDAVPAPATATGYRIDPGSRSLLQERDVLGTRKDGLTTIVEVWLSAARIHDSRVTVVSVIDNTWRRNAELELSRQRDEMAHLSRVAMLGELSGSMAHELNQPLTAILSNAQACQQLSAQGRLDVATLDEILSDIVADTRRAGEVIRRLRGLMRRGETVLEAVDLNAVATEVLRLLGTDFIDRRVSVETSLTPGLPPVTGDRVQLQQVVLNLVLNACDAMDDVPQPRRLVVGTRLDEEDRVHLTVSDTGTGVASDTMERLFEPFFTTKGQGLGLGLSVCRTIIEHCGGKIGAANNPSRGATFNVTLKKAPPPA